MPEILIPLVGIIDIDMETFEMVGIVVAKSALIHDVKIDDEVWELLIVEKIKGRFRNLNDVIRVRFGLRPNGSMVKNYSDEGEQNAIIQH